MTKTWWLSHFQFWASMRFLQIAGLERTEIYRISSKFKFSDISYLIQLHDCLCFVPLANIIYKNISTNSQSSIWTKSSGNRNETFRALSLYVDTSFNWALLMKIIPHFCIKFRFTSRCDSVCVPKGILRSLVRGDISGWEETPSVAHLPRPPVLVALVCHVDHVSPPEL